MARSKEIQTKHMMKDINRNRWLKTAKSSNVKAMKSTVMMWTDLQARE